jgi:hypothetical protein
MATTINILIGLFVGLLTGLASGYYFERRSSKAAQREATELRAQLRQLRESVYTMGAGHERSGSPADEVLASATVLGWIRQHQDASGRIPRSRLYDHFLASGHRLPDIIHEVEALQAARQIDGDHQWIEVRSQ